MTVNALMTQTDVGRSAFYRHFKDLHEVMETLLEILQDEIFAATRPWLACTGDPVALMNETFTDLVRVCHERGPFIRAVADAATSEQRMEQAWQKFLNGFDDAACARIESDQAQGLIPEFDARPVAIALTRLNTYTLIEAFGQRPRRQPKPVRDALARIWISTLYRSEHSGSDTANLVRHDTNPMVN